ncbi:MAG: cytochrome c [Sulfuricella sp.]|nr:cytochrome c [Sulfuricella sp.]
MKHTALRTTLFGVAAALASTCAVADDTFDFGKRTYDSNCATCHGLTGKGDGPFKANLTVQPADLTTIARKNNGVVPVSRLYAVIDGRMAINSHGPRDMPVWGSEFSAQAGTDWQKPMDVAFNPEVFVRSRIMALVDYIARLQEK